MIEMGTERAIEQNPIYTLSMTHGLQSVNT
jgi:hypothetical protein